MVRKLSVAATPPHREPVNNRANTTHKGIVPNRRQRVKRSVVKWSVVLTRRAVVQVDSYPNCHIVQIGALPMTLSPISGTAKG